MSKHKHANPPEEKNEQIPEGADENTKGTAQAEPEDFKDKYLRALADYQNLVKQSHQEKQEFAKYANEQLLHELLPVYDNLKLAISHCGENSDGWFEGVKHVTKQFKEVLSGYGVEEIEPLGQEFDYMTMDAADKEPTDKKDDDNKVSKVLKPGYKLNGKVIVHAKVVIFEFKE